MQLPLKNIVHRARLLAPRELVFEDVTLQLPLSEPGSFLAETEVSAVSVGTELAAYVGERPLRPGPIYPRLVGYCNVARVLDVEGGASVRPGERVLTHRSHESAFVGKASEVLAVVPTAVSSDVASLTYLGYIGLGALRKASARAGENVAVLGLGVIGLATIAIARSMGARVIAIGNDQSRMREAIAQGAEACFAWDDPELPTLLLNATEQRGIDVVLTTVNSWAAWRTTMGIPRIRGRIAVVGFPGRSEGAPTFNPLESSLFYDKQLSIFSSGSAFAGADGADAALAELRREMSWLVRLAATPAHPWQRLITHRFAWRDLGKVYELAAGHDRSLIGAVLDWKDPP
jgi:threonine dehydrogenase-like Zn-dependent dehydrogenase